MFPAAGYFYLAWRMFADRRGQDVNSFPVQFRQVNLRRMTVISEASPAHFQFSILSESGQFEIRESSELVAEGRLTAVKEASRSLLSPLDDQLVCMTLSSEEFYKEARMRGYTFSGAFCSVTQMHYGGIVCKLSDRINLAL